MQIVIDISKEKYDEIMSMDWVNCRRFFDEELRAIHDGKVLESCEDAISRQAVLNLINADWKYEGLEEDVSSLPPVNPQPKTGHWIYVCNSEVNGLKICKCSNCKKKTYGSHNYCPNCGAKVQEVEE